MEISNHVEVVQEKVVVAVETVSARDVVVKAQSQVLVVVVAVVEAAHVLDVVDLDGWMGHFYSSMYQNQRLWKELLKARTLWIVEAVTGMGYVVNVVVVGGLLEAGIHLTIGHVDAVEAVGYVLDVVEPVRFPYSNNKEVSIDGKQ